MSQTEIGVKHSFVSPFIVPPGEILEEKINELGLSTEEFAEQIGMSVDALVQLFKGRLALSETLATNLEAATEIPVEYWNRAEWAYRTKLTKLENEYHQKYEQ